MEPTVCDLIKIQALLQQQQESKMKCTSILSALLAACCLCTITATAIKQSSALPVHETLLSSDESQKLSGSSFPHFSYNNLRRLAVGDFDRFNELFDNAKISVPGTYNISEDVAFTTLDMTIKDIVCYDITVGDAALSHVRNSNQDIDVMVNVTQLDINCNLSYNYRYGFLKGTGDAVVTTSGSSMSTTIGFTSSNFDLSPPNASQVQSCVTNLEITNIDFSGDFVSNIVEVFEGSIRNTIETKIEDLACQELSSLGTSFVVDMLGLAEETLGRYDAGSLGPAVSDLLYLERTYKFPPGLVALDLLDTENTTVIGRWFNQALDQADKLFSTVVSDPNSPTGTGQDLGINKMIRNTFLDENRALVIAVEQLPMDGVLFQGSDKLTETTITLQQVKLLGLDSLTYVTPMQEIGHYTLQTDMHWRKLTLVFDVMVDIRPSTSEDSILQDATSDGIQENISINFGLENMNVNTSLFLVVDEEALADMKIGPLLNTTYIMPCLLSTLHTVQLSGLQIDPQSVIVPTLTGFVSPGLDRIITDAADAAFDMYKGSLERTLPIIIRDLLNGLAKTYLTSDPCPQVAPPSSDSPFIDFVALFANEGNMYGVIPTLLENLLDSELLALNNQTGRPKINEVLIAPFTEKQSGKEGSLVFEGDLFGGTRRVRVGGLDANVELRASDARIENLDTISSPLEILAPVLNRPYMLNNTATFGLDDRPLHFGLRFLLSLTGDDNLTLRNDLDISLDLSQATIGLLAMLKVATSRLFEFPLRDLSNVDCWLATIPAPELNAQGIRRTGVQPTASVSDLVTAIASLNLNITCVECTSPKMAELADLLSSRNAQDAAKETTSRILDYFEYLGTGDFLQIQLDRALNDASKRCPHSPTYDPKFVSSSYDTTVVSSGDDSTTFLVLLGGVVLGLFVVLGLAAFSVRWFVRRRHRKWLLTRTKEQVAMIAQRQKESDSREAQLDSGTQSMFKSQDIPVFVRWFMPVVILGNIGFFLSGHLSLGATVNIVAEFAGQKIVVENFFEFSMAQSTLDIWNAGGHALALLILILSGIWPYTKQFLTLALWFLPPSRCSTSRRGAILLWLDWLAKWSIIDIFVLVISLAAFRVSINSPDVAFLPDDFYSINLLVVPLWGLYANMIAQLLSQVSSHFILHYHRHIIHMWQTRHLNKNTPHSLESTGLDTGSSEEQVSAHNEGRSDVLYEHRFGRPHRGEDEKLVIRGWVNKFLIAASVCLTLFVLLGCILPTFSLSILGIIGITVESGQGFEDASTQHNVFTVAKLLFEEARFLGTLGDWVGLVTLSLLFLFSILIVPLVQCAVLLRQWFGASTQRQRSRLAIVIETLSAWQYAEVYLIAIFVASWQLGPISEFLINSYCGSLNATFAQWVLFGIIKPEDAQCFSIESSIEAGSYILAMGAVVLGFVNSFVNKAVIQYFRDMEEKAPRDLEQNRDNEFSTDDVVTMSKKIRPVPVLFTDNFRWFLLQGRDTESYSASTSSGNEGGYSHKNTARTFMIEEASNNSSFDDETRSIEVEATDPSEMFDGNRDRADGMVQST